MIDFLKNGYFMIYINTEEIPFEFPKDKRPNYIEIDSETGFIKLYSDVKSVVSTKGATFLGYLNSACVDAIIPIETEEP